MSSRQEKRKQVRRARDGKIDLIEDQLGTEELKGTYEDRDKAAKILAIDRAMQAEKDRLIMKGFRDREEARLQEILSNQEIIKSINQQIEFLLYNTMEREAFMYLDEIRYRDNELCNKITYALVPPEDMNRLTSLCQRILDHGPPKNKIQKDWVIRLERAFTNRKPKVEVERDGKREGLLEGRKFA